MWCEDLSDREGRPDRAFVQENQNQQPEQTSLLSPFLTGIIQLACEVALSPVVLCGERGPLEAGSFQHPQWYMVGLPSS